MYIRKASERGTVNHGWLLAKHSFSFGNYYDPKHMGFQNLRVINQDIVAPGKGFGPHPHQNMEIITYIIRGAVEHQDNMGNKEVISEGELQVMEAGTGVVHSEVNPSPKQELELLQIWIEPKTEGIKPSYNKLLLSQKTSKDDLALIISPDGKSGSMKIAQDVEVYAGKFKTAKMIEKPLKPGQSVWLQIISGSLTTESVKLEAGDGLGFEAVQALKLEVGSGCEFLTFIFN